MTKATGEQVWTIRRLLEFTSGYLERHGVDQPRLSAEMLLAHVLELPRIKLFMDMDRPATPLERAAYRDLIEKAAQHHPVQYLTGRASFFSLLLEVNSAVLIPRPCTESLVEHVLQHIRRTPGFASPILADVGTGSGAIAIALAKNLPQARIVATDISEAALEVARRNAATHGVTDRITFRHGSLYEPLSGTAGPFDFIVSNPPYIPDHEWPDQVDRNVRDYEPTLALRGGPDGLSVVKPLIEQAHAHLRSPGQLVLEIAAATAPAVLDLARSAKGLSNPRVLPDHEGHARFLIADHG
jgi:release factor glutamine methyltransferase